MSLRFVSDPDCLERTPDSFGWPWVTARYDSNSEAKSITPQCAGDHSEHHVSTFRSNVEAIHCTYVSLLATVNCAIVALLPVTLLLMYVGHVGHASESSAV